MIEIIFPCIERRHCIDIVLKNMERAYKPEDTQILSIISGSDEYIEYVRERLNKIFKKVRIFKNWVHGIEHDEIRKDPKVTATKTSNVFDVYRIALSNVDHSAEYYWIIEDDTLFPLNVLRTYQNVMAGFDADAVSGISYYWHDEMKRNFWNLNATSVFPDDDTCKEVTLSLSDMKPKEHGVVRLGATGFGNVLIKRGAFLGWEPQYKRMCGADIDYFAYLEMNGFKAYGIWDVYLPHITKYENGDMAILGRLDKSLIPLFQ